MSKVTDTVTALARPLVEASGCSLWDVEYLREAGEWYLRLYIDVEGGVSIHDCEVVSRAVGDALDEADPIPSSYIFEVCSAGDDRILRTPAHFAAMNGREVEVRLYRARDGRKNYIGTLTGYDRGRVTIQAEGADLTFEKQDIAQVRLYVRY